MKSINIFKMVAVVMCSLATVSFTGCTKDNNDSSSSGDSQPSPNPEPPATFSLVGKIFYQYWRGNNGCFTYDNNWEEICIDYVSFTFKTDSEGEFYEEWHNLFGDATGQGRVAFTYTFDGEKGRWDPKGTDFRFHGGDHSIRYDSWNGIITINFDNDGELFHHFTR